MIDVAYILTMFHDTAWFNFLSITLQEVVNCVSNAKLERVDPCFSGHTNN